MLPLAPRQRVCAHLQLGGVSAPPACMLWAKVEDSGGGSDSGNSSDSYSSDSSGSDSGGNDAVV